MRPQEFWSLTVPELHWLIESQRKPKMYGKYTEEQIAQLYRETYGDPPDG